MRWRKESKKMNYHLKELSIELTNYCLMKCLMCSSGSMASKGKDELTNEEIIYLIFHARELGATTLSLSGGDPITLGTDVHEYITYARMLGYDEVLFYTTGVQSLPLEWITSEFLTPIHDTPKLVFVFSLHSHKPEVNDYIMGRTGAWKSIVSSIDKVIRSGIRVWVHMVPMLPNWHDAPKLMTMCNSMRVEQMSLLRFVPQTRGKANNKQLAMDRQDFIRMQYMMQNLMDSWLPKIKIRLGCPIDFRHTVYDNVKTKMHECHAGIDLILVRPNGDVHPCAAWKTLPGDDNIRNKSLKEIWKSGETFTALRDFRDTGWKALKGPCGRCRYRQSCKSGCLAQRLHDLPEIYPTIQGIYEPYPDPLCPAARALE